MASESRDKPFKCPKCAFKSKFKEHVQQHLKNVHLAQPAPASSRPFPCPESGCGYAVKDKATLKQQSKIHCDQKSFFCAYPNCNYSTNQKYSLISHTRIHTCEKPYVCQFESCSFASKTKYELGIHSKTHTKEKPFKCQEPNCEYAAASNFNLKRHELTHSPKEGEERPSFSCPICKYSTKYKSDLSGHIKRHTLEKLFQCDEPNCNFEARTKSEIKNHKVVHSDEKPLACPVESWEFRCKYKTNLTTHLKTHSEDRRYKCELCPFRGKTRTVVTKHLQNVHSDPDFRPFKCTKPNCDSTFKTKSHLNTHLLIHNGEKKYPCSFPDCEYRAVLKHMVQSHEKYIHILEQKEKCTVCLYTCKARSALTVHMKTHMKEEPHKG